ncbi:MAG: PadR family transcriptional regulator [Candidatus Borkfalkia sp.]
MYSALKRLETQDFVTSYWGGVSNGGRRKYFQLTEKGKIVAEHNLAEWEYSRTVIDNLISEREFDFNKPAPAAVDFNLLKKSTTRVRGVKGEDEEDIDLSFDFTEQAKDEPFSTEKAIEPEPADEPRTLNDSDVNEFMREQNAAQNEPPAEEPSPLSEEEKQRIHENYKLLMGEENDATAYYYSHMTQQQRFEQQRQCGAASEEAAPENPADLPTNETAYTAPQTPEQDATYLENNAIASELLYSNKSPAERNYKQLLAKLYDNTQRYPDESEYDESYFEERVAESAAQPAYEPQQTMFQNARPTAAEPPVQPQNAVYDAPAANTASTIEFYDVREKAENDGLKVNTANSSRTRTQVKTVGNTYDKGKVLFTTALYVFIIAIIESIVSICLKGVLKTNAAYVVLPFVASFVMLGVFMFLYLKGYGRNSRKTQAKSYVSASLILFANLVLIICLIAYLIIVYNEISPTFTDILKYAIFPCVFAFNIPLFAIFYNYNRNKQ